MDRVTGEMFGHAATTRDFEYILDYYSMLSKKELFVETFEGMNWSHEPCGYSSRRNQANSAPSNEYWKIPNREGAKHKKEEINAIFYINLNSNRLIH